MKDVNIDDLSTIEILEAIKSDIELIKKQSLNKEASESFSVKIDNKEQVSEYASAMKGYYGHVEINEFIAMMQLMGMLRGNEMVDRNV